MAMGALCSPSFTVSVPIQLSPPLCIWRLAWACFVTSASILQAFFLPWTRSLLMTGLGLSVFCRNACGGGKACFMPALTIAPSATSLLTDTFLCVPPGRPSYVWVSLVPICVVCVMSMITGPPITFGLGTASLGCCIFT